MSTYPDSYCLSASSLSSEKQDRFLFQNLSFRIEPGMVLHIKGANGSGKTTLLRIICGLTLADSGEILWNDTPISKQQDEYFTQLSYVGHTDGIKQDLTVEENLQVAAVLAQGKQQRPKTINLQDTMHQVGLNKKRYAFAYALSAGQRRRLALARCLLNDTSIWVLDEPLTALDIEGVKLVEDLIKQHIQRNGIAIVTSHQKLDIHDSHYQILELA
jgi:heme exporter protein A